MEPTVNFSEFCDALKPIQNSFSYGGKKALFDYLKEVEGDTGEKAEWDTIGLCCGFTEYKNLKEFQRDYGKWYQTMDKIRETTTVIKINEEAFIIVTF